MLQPSDRQHLFESLCPPDGYSLDWGMSIIRTENRIKLKSLIR
ncbi:MAG: hypothetical protein V7K57_09130 [Nostoc sp.]